MSLRSKRILVGISGGIAAYKIPELIRSLVKAGAEVRVATTHNALQFVTELTLQTVSGNRVYSDVFAAINEHATEHISLPEWADILLVAPATANVVCKTATGIADDALTTTICSCVARKPIVIAPAMNDKMWENAAVQQAIATLRTWKNLYIIEPAEGPLACGTSGKGRMPEIEELQEALYYALSEQTMAGKRVLITAGGTQEKIDPVRFISNYSTG
ncbi:MAG: bifunctional phosphopantothenoylcysteine decarboxylase/phosphopantothenate--cysteine ligase CoaBC, partial [Paludibacteraceae bacterium]|nr:bifunctional phosphopantothenoylcysteine decarboxylase/phosphopantothenate--cysteine ligase CoaBC [Paludibacteraceae bacterium]